MVDRRGFFARLGALVVGGASAVFGGYDAAKEGESDSAMFNFTCNCGEGLCAEVPEEIGEKVSLKCGCGTTWEMEWLGDRFKTTMIKNVLPFLKDVPFLKDKPSEEPDWVKEAHRIARENPEKLEVHRSAFAQHNEHEAIIEWMRNAKSTQDVIDE